MPTKAEFQRIRSLREKKHRVESGLFVVEGEKVIGELLAAKFPLTEIYATPAWKGNPTQRVSEADMGKLSHFPTPSPVLAVGRLSDRPLEPGTLDRGLTLALDGVQDPGNVGTLIRIADWFGLSRVLLSPDTADLYSQKVINASMGSFARVIVHTAELPQAFAGVKAPILGCDLEGENVFQRGKLEDAVIVIGAEGRGLSPAVRERLTGRISIPRLGKAESLNAAVAAGIVCAAIRL